MSLAAVKDDELPAEKPEVKKQSVVDRFDQLAQLIFANADDIMTRRLNGVVVEKQETENQELLMKDLNVYAKTIALLKKHGRFPDTGPSEEFGDVDKMLERVKAKKSSIGEIVRTLPPGNSK